MSKSIAAGNPPVVLVCTAKMLPNLQAVLHAHRAEPHGWLHHGGHQPDGDGHGHAGAAAQGLRGSSE